LPVLVRWSCTAICGVTLPRRSSSTKGFAVDASLIQADANKQRSIPSDEWDIEAIPADAIRAVKNYLETLDDAAVGAAGPKVPQRRIPRGVYFVTSVNIPATSPAP